MEEHFKNKLKNHKVDWDKEELLGNLQKELSQKKSRFNRRWLWLLPLLFIGTCWGVSDFGFSSPDLTGVETTMSTDLIDSKIENNEANIVDSNQTEDDETTIANPIVNNSKSNQPTETTQVIHSTPSKNKLPKIGNSNLSEQNSTLINGEKIGFDKTIFENENKSYKNSFSNIESRDRINPLELIPTLEVKTFQLEMEAEPNFIFPELSVEVPKEIEKIAEVKNYFFASTSGEIGLINRTLKSPANDRQPEEELNLKEETINSRFLVSTNLSIGYQHRSKWFLQSGLEYQRVVEFFKLDDSLSNVNYKVWNEKAHYFVNQNSDTLFFADSSAVVDTRIRKVRHNNFHTFYTIPLKVGYRHEIGKVNVLGIAGVSFAFANKFKGREGQLLEPDEIRVVDNPVYILKNRIGFQFSLGAEYPLSKRTNVFMKTAYRRSPTLLFSEVDEQFYQSVSLGVGVRYRLF